MDILEVLKFSYSWIFDRSAWKYYGFLLLLSVFTYALSAFLSAPSQSPSPILLILLLLFILLFILSLVFQDFIGAKIAIHALNSKGIKTPEFSVTKYIRYWIMRVLSFFYAAFCWFNKKYLVFLFGSLIGIIILLIGLSLGGFSLISQLREGDITSLKEFGTPLLLVLLGLVFIIPCGIVYFVILIYNIIRLYFTGPIFLSKEIGITDALSQSWNITEKRVGDIFLVLLVCGIVWLVVFMVIGAISFIWKLVVIALTAILAFGLSLFLGGGGATVIGVITYFLGGLVDIITAPIFIFVFEYMIVGVYCGLLKKD